MLRNHAVQVIELQDQVHRLERECKVLKLAEGTSQTEKKLAQLQDFLIEKETAIINLEKSLEAVKAEYDAETRKSRTFAKDQREENRRLKSQKNNFGGSVERVSGEAKRQ